MRDSCWTAAWRWQYVIRSGVGRGWDHLPPALCGQQSHVRLHRIGESLSLQTSLGWPWLWDLHPWLQKPLYRTLWPPSPTAIWFYPILLSVLLVQRFQLLLGPAALREDNGKTPFWRKTFLFLFSPLTPAQPPVEQLGLLFLFNVTVFIGNSSHYHDCKLEAGLFHSATYVQFRKAAVVTDEPEALFARFKCVTIDHPS